jgi:DNA polymerase-3 subunit gamma/tau
MYQALYRKYRPQTFSDVVGQKSVTDTLRAQLTSGRLSHAYLFTGTRGTGKTSCAKILAKAVNCENLQNGDPCNVCPACRAIDAGSCLDVQEIDAASNNGVDSVRILRDDAIYTPGTVKKRVYIIDEVHMLSTAAFNALLKIIEEPPEHLLFILATTELHKVPATILSRCQRFSFRRLLPEDIAARLNYVAYQEKIELEPDAAQLLARLADGALRDGLSLLDQCASASEGPVTAELVYRSLGLAGDRRTAELMTAVADRDASRALSLFSELYANGKDITAMLDELLCLSRDLLVLKTAPKSGASMLSGVCTEKEIAGLLGRFSPAELLRITQLLHETELGFVKSASRRIDAELCLMQLCEPALALDPASLSARLGRVEEQLASGAVLAAPAKAPAPAAAEAPAQPADDDRPPFPSDDEAPPEEPGAAPAPAEATFWPELVAKIRDALSVREKGFFAPNGPVQPVLAGDVLTLAADSEFVLGMIRKPEIEKIVQGKAAAVLGRPVRVKFALKSQVGSTGKDPLDELVAFGDRHNDIFTIK